MADAVGRYEAIKKRLMELIQDSSTVLNSDNVTGNQDKIETYLMANELPFVVTQLSETTQQIDVIGRRTPSAGRYLVYPFQLQLFHSACSESGESRERYAHQISDEIQDYLDSRRSLEGGNYIQDIYGLQGREALFGGVTPKLIRFVINGRLLVLREDVAGVGSSVPASTQADQMDTESVNTATVGLKTGNVTFNTPYSSTPKLTWSIQDPNANVDWGRVYFTNITTTGFTWNVEVINAVAGTTLTLVWRARVG